MKKKKISVWLITGCSTGFGRALAEYLLEQKQKVVVTARNPKTIQDLIKKYPRQALGLRLDVNNKKQAAQAVRKTLQTFGRIDVLVNNAGYGYLGAVEESDEKEIRAMFETNFFALARLTQMVLPVMRKQRSGCIVNISSIGGLTGLPSLGFYCATKFAVEGLSESLAKEVLPLGIKVILIEPGPFRTDWAGRSIRRQKQKIDDYDMTSGARQRWLSGINGRQPGDPSRAAQAIFRAVQSSKTPLRLLLGKAAFLQAKKHIESVKNDFTAWKKTALSADFPEK